LYEIRTNKNDLSERDICSKFIGPAVKRAGWDEEMQIREEGNFTKGLIIVRGMLVSVVKPSAPITSSQEKNGKNS
jgi:type I site-specific restriction endonuclease